MNQEETIEAQAIWKDILKGEFRVYFTRDTSDIYAPVYAYVFFKDCNNRYLYSRLFYPDQEYSKMLEVISHDIFTEDELISPCPSMDEYVRRKRYLIEDYPRYVPNWYIIDKDQDKYVFDPVKQAYAPPCYKDFVDHHIWLYAQLIKTIKPTLFPMTNEWINRDRMELYLALLPYAADDDPNLEAVKEYVSKNARKYAKDYYERGYTKMALKLVQEGYIKKPTLRKLLEMANEKDDAQFAAILVDMLGESTKKGSKFTL